MNYDGIKIGDLFSESYYGKHLALSKAFNVLYSTRQRTDLTAQDINVKNTGIEDDSNVYEVVEPGAVSSSAAVYNKAFKKNDVFNISYPGIIIEGVAGVGNENIGVLAIKNNSNKAMYIQTVTYHAKLKNGNIKEGISSVGYSGIFGTFTNDGPIPEAATIIKRGATLEYDLTTNIELFRTNNNNVVATLAFGAHQVNFDSTNQSTTAEPSIPTTVTLTQPMLVEAGSTIGILAKNITVFGAGVDIQASINVSGFFADETDF